MNISAPAFTETASEARVTSTFTFDTGEKHEVYFETTPEFAKYLVHEVSDAFIVAAMLPALVNGEDIHVESVSDYLSYNFDPLLYLFGKVFGYPPIKLHAKQVLHLEFNPQAVGTGFSGGIDSLATYLEHTSEKCPKEFRVNHLALFNVGAYGNDPVKTSKNFHDDLKRAMEFAKEVNIPLIPLNSNLSSIYTHKDIYHYVLRTTLCLSAAVLCLQKLFRQYYISSTGTIDDIRLSKHEQYPYECLFIQRLCTANTNIMISEAHFDRVEKTKRVIQSELAQKHLYVCAADVMNEKFGMNHQKEGYKNCSECFKCKRTLLTIDLLGKLEEYKHLFNLDKYYKLKDELILQMHIEKEYDHFQKEIYDLFQETNTHYTPHQMTLIKNWEHQPNILYKAYLRVRSMAGRIIRKLLR